MDSKLFHPVRDVDLLTHARRNARALALAARIGDEAAWMVSAARLKRALLRANATLGQDKSSIVDLTRATELYALTVETRTMREMAPTRVTSERAKRVLSWGTAKTSLGNSGAHADLFDVDASDRELGLATLCHLFLLRVRFARSGLVGACFDDVVLDQSYLNCAMANSSRWSSAQLSHCQLIGCDLSDAILSYAHFTDCDLRGADLGSLRRPDPGGIGGAMFVRCDLRDTQWAGRRLNDVVLFECKLHGARGRPDLDGAVIVKPDLSRDGDGSYIGTGDEVRALWGSPGPILCSKLSATPGDQNLLHGCAISPETDPDSTDLGVLMALASAQPGVRQ